jgi:hypothetical protein
MRVLPDDSPLMIRSGLSLIQISWRALVAGCVCAACVACTPAYDWRTLHNDAGYSIDLPAKPTVETHPVEIGGARMAMRMQAAHVSGSVYAVGTVMLPDARDATQRAVLEYLRTGLARNLGAEPAVRPVQVPLAGGGQTAGVELRVDGAAAGPEHARKILVARLVARGQHVYQAVVIADAMPTDEQLEQFFGSLKLD